MLGKCSPAKSNFHAKVSRTSQIYILQWLHLTSGSHPLQAFFFCIVIAGPILSSPSLGFWKPWDQLFVWGSFALISQNPASNVLDPATKGYPGKARMSLASGYLGVTTFVGTFHGLNLKHITTFYFLHLPMYQKWNKIRSIQDVLKREECKITYVQVPLGNNCSRKPQHKSHKHIHPFLQEGPTLACNKMSYTQETGELDSQTLPRYRLPTQESFLACAVQWKEIKRTCRLE